jgi:hypothetical protein
MMSTLPGELLARHLEMISKQSLILLAAMLAFPASQLSAAVISGGAFTLIAGSSSEFTPITFGPSMNGRGEVAFTANVFDRQFAATRATVLKGDGNSLQSIADNRPGSGLHSVDGQGVSINDNGVVAFHANITTSQRGLFASSGPGAGNRTTIATGDAFGGSGTYNSFGNTTINNAGTVAANVSVNGLPQADGGIRIVAGNGTAASDVFSTAPLGGGPDRFFFLYNPHINQTGTYAFIGQDTGQRTGLFIGSSQQNVVAAAVAGLTHVGSNTLTGNSIATPALNDNGQAAFISAFTGPSGNGQGVFLYQPNGAISTIATTQDGFGTFNSIGSNNAGEVAYSANAGSGHAGGIYKGPEENKIIAAGDAINVGGATKTVADVQFNGAFNDAGQLAFFARFTDSSTGILRFDPAGSTADVPLLPLSVDGGAFGFEINVSGGLGSSSPIFIDPIVAIGYDYLVTGGPLFSSVLLPMGIGDDLYDLFVWNGSSYDFLQTLMGGVTFTFSSPVDRFRIRGIEVGAGLDPNDPNAFVTGLTFSGMGTANVTMTPLTFDTDADPTATPEPASLYLFALVLAGPVFGRHRTRKRV